MPYCGQGEFWQDAALCVAAYGTETDPAVYSDWGHEIDVSAPGGGLLTCDGGIWSTVPLDLEEVDSCTETRGYAVLAGTSMATPHAAGVGAMLADLGVPGAAARQRIVDTARNAGPRRWSAASPVRGWTPRPRSSPEHMSNPAPGVA